MNKTVFLSFKERSDRVIYDTCLDNIDHLTHIINCTEDRLHILKTDLKKQEEVKRHMEKRMNKIG